MHLVLLARQLHLPRRAVMAAWSMESASSMRGARPLSTLPLASWAFPGAGTSSENGLVT
ncbi:MAG: hypothetical protein ACLT98_16270 [Eggerthellaceae bacterium]